MANMSYCRFSNTLRDLADCAEALEAGKSPTMSDAETKARLELIRLCAEIAADYGDEVANG